MKDNDDDDDDDEDQLMWVMGESDEDGVRARQRDGGRTDNKTMDMIRRHVAYGYGTIPYHS